MSNVAPRSTFRYTKLPSGRRCYGQNYAWRAQRGPLQSKAQPTITSEDGTKTLRLRPNHGGGETTLPLPPLMDPIAIAAKERYKLPKRKQAKPEEMTAFSKALEANPFAQALATPIRKCAFSRAHLPSHFLQQYQANFRVKDGHLRGYIIAKSSQQHQNENQNVDLEGQDAGFAKTKSYAFSSKRLIDELQRGSRKKRNWQSLLSQRIRDVYEQRAKALRSQVASTGKAGEDWTFDVCGEQIEHGLVDEVVRAFEQSLKMFPDRRRLAPPSRLEEMGVPFSVVSSPRKLWHDSNMDQVQDVEQISHSGFEGDVLIPVYDLVKLGVAERLGQLNLELDSQDFSMLGILQNKQALQLHLTLQKLALFLGQGAPHHWFEVKKGDLPDRGTDDVGENYILPPCSDIQSEPGSQSGTWEGYKDAGEENESLDDVYVPLSSPESEFVNAVIGHGEQVQAVMEKGEEVDDRKVVEDVDRGDTGPIDEWEEVEYDDGYGGHDGDDF